MAEGSRAMDAVLSGQLDLESYLKGRLKQAGGGPAAADTASRLPPTTNLQKNPTKRRQDLMDQKEYDDEEDEEEDEGVPCDLYDEWGLERGEIPQGGYPFGFSGHHRMPNSFASRGGMHPPRGLPAARGPHPMFPERQPGPRGQVPHFQRKAMQHPQQQGMRHQVNYLQHPPGARPRPHLGQPVSDQHSQRVHQLQDYKEAATGQRGSGLGPVPQGPQRKQGPGPAEQGQEQHSQQKLQAPNQPQRKILQPDGHCDQQLSTSSGVKQRRGPQRQVLPSQQEYRRFHPQAQRCQEGLGAPKQGPRSQKQNDYLECSSESDCEDEAIQGNWFRNPKSLPSREQHGKPPLGHDGAHRPMPAMPPGEHMEIDCDEMEEDEYYEGCGEELSVDYEDELSEDELEFAHAERVQYADYQHQKVLTADGGRHAGHYAERQLDKSGMLVPQYRDASKPVLDRPQIKQLNTKAEPPEQVHQSRLPLATPIQPPPERLQGDSVHYPAASKGRTEDQKSLKQQDTSKHKAVLPAKGNTQLAKEHGVRSVPKARVPTNTLDHKAVSSKPVVPKERVFSGDVQSRVSDQLTARAKAKDSDQPLEATRSSYSAADSDVDDVADNISSSVAAPVRSVDTPKPCLGQSVDEPVCLVSDSDEDDGRPLACLRDERPPSDEDEEEEDSLMQDTSIVSISVDEESDDPENPKTKENTQDSKESGAGSQVPDGEGSWSVAETDRMASDGKQASKENIWALPSDAERLAEAQRTERFLSKAIPDKSPDSCGENLEGKSKLTPEIDFSTDESSPSHNLAEPRPSPATMSGELECEHKRKAAPSPDTASVPEQLEPPTKKQCKPEQRKGDDRGVSSVKNPSSAFHEGEGAKEGEATAKKPKKEKESESVQTADEAEVEDSTESQTSPPDTTGIMSSSAMWMSMDWQGLKTPSGHRMPPLQPSCVSHEKIPPASQMEQPGAVPSLDSQEVPPSVSQSVVPQSPKSPGLKAAQEMMALSPGTHGLMSAPKLLSSLPGPDASGTVEATNEPHSSIQLSNSAEREAVVQGDTVAESREEADSGSADQANDGATEEPKKKGRKKKTPEQLAKDREARKRRKEENKLKTPEQLAEEKAEKERLRKEKKEQQEKEKEEKARKKREREAMTPEEIAAEKARKRKEYNEKRAKERREKREEAKRRKENGECSDDSDSEKKQAKKSYERRNIRKIISDDALEAETKTAQEEEMERRKRVQEKERILAQQMKAQREEEARKLEQQQQDFNEQLQKELEELERELEQEPVVDLESLSAVDRPMLSVDLQQQQQQQVMDKDGETNSTPAVHVTLGNEDVEELEEAGLLEKPWPKVCAEVQEKGKPEQQQQFIPQRHQPHPQQKELMLKQKMQQVKDEEDEMDEDDEEEIIEQIEDEEIDELPEGEEEVEEEKLKQEKKRETEEKPKTSHLLSLLEDNSYKTEEEKTEDEVAKKTSASLQKEQPVKAARSECDSDDVVEISDSDDDVVMLPSEEEEDEEELRRRELEEEDAEDPENSGSHVNDAMNQPDAEGRVLVNVGHPPDEPDIFLAPQLSLAVKPHQIGGIRFLYDNLVESVSQFKHSNGFGCILAHSMGLGKTIQVISFVDVVLRHTAAKTVLCIVPVNTLQNWVNEFNMWLPQPDDPKVQGKSKEEVRTREFKVNVITDNLKTTQQRAAVVDDWHSNGGVLLMGYEMYRLLTSKRVLHKPKRRKKKGSNVPEIIDLEEEDRNQELMLVMHGSLVRPGPDLVICDEGHRIKNSHASISQALKSIRTKRRVVLTGYPLQNNLMEYWCMVDFVRPNFLGTKTEFSNMFERPIMNGQCVDSTPQDSRLMRFRAHVLHSLLEGFVQRRGHTVLRAALPAKEEYVLLIRMSDIQRKLYTLFMHIINDSGLDAWANNNPIKAFSVCCKIWNHPDVLHKIVKKEVNITDDLDIDEALKTDPGAKKGKGKGAAAAACQKVRSSPVPGASLSTSQKTSSSQGCGTLKEPLQKSDAALEKSDAGLQKSVEGTLKALPLQRLRSEGQGLPDISQDSSFHNPTMEFEQREVSEKQSQNGMPAWCRQVGKPTTAGEQTSELKSPLVKQDADQAVQCTNGSASWAQVSNSQAQIELQRKKSSACSVQELSGQNLKQDSQSKSDLQSSGIASRDGQVISQGVCMEQGQPHGMKCDDPSVSLPMHVEHSLAQSGDLTLEGLKPKEEDATSSAAVQCSPSPNLNADQNLSVPSEELRLAQKLSESSSLHRTLHQGEASFPWGHSPLNVQKEGKQAEFARKQDLIGKELPLKDPSHTVGSSSKASEWKAQLINQTSSRDSEKEHGVSSLDRISGLEDMFKQEAGLSRKASADPDPKVQNQMDIMKKTGEGNSSTQQAAQEEGLASLSGKDSKDLNVITYDWAKALMKDYVPGLLEHGGKMLVLMAIIEETLKIGEKLLIFSQSLFTLSLIEEYLSKQHIPLEGCTETWIKNKNYFRLDGSTHSLEREKLISQFNSPENKQLHVFLLSTRAGCLGINLVGANRVVVMDASWNPCHDSQAVCRVYRYGQTKPCFVYRLVTDNCMEKKIYDRQINKQGVADRVVDELNPQNYVRKNVDVLLQYQDRELPHVAEDSIDKYRGNCGDPVLSNVISDFHWWLTQEPFTHESLLIDRKETRLTKSEKRLAKQSYEMEKKRGLSYARPSYAAFYPKAPGGLMAPNYVSRLASSRPVASVRPMMSSLPMRPGGLGHQARGPVPLVRPGVSVQQVQTTTDIVIPGTNTATSSGPSKIPAGENVLVIKTTKGVYIRTNTGRIFAVRSKGQPDGVVSASVMSSQGQAPPKQTSPVVVSKPAVRPLTANKPQMTTMSGARPGVKVVHIKPKVMGPKGQEVAINPTLVPRPMMKKGGPGGGVLTMTTTSSTMAKPPTMMVVTATSAKTATVTTKTPSATSQLQNLSQQVHRINISQPSRPGLKGAASQPSLPKYGAQNVKKGLAKEADLLAIQKAALAALAVQPEGEDRSDEDMSDSRSDEETLFHSVGQGLRPASKTSRGRDATFRLQGNMSRSHNITPIEAQKTPDISEDESDELEDEYLFAAQQKLQRESANSKKTPLLQAQKNQRQQEQKPASATDSSSQESWGEQEQRRESVARGVSSNADIAKNSTPSLKAGNSVKSQPGAPTVSVSTSRSRVSASGYGHNAASREGPKASTSAASNFSIASMVGESLSNDSNSSTHAARRTTAQNSSFFPGQNVVEKTSRKENKRSEQEESLPDLNFGSMLGLLGGSDSPGLSGWNDMDTSTGSGSDVDRKPNVQAPQYPGSAFNKEVPYGGGQSGSYADASIHGSQQYPYGSSTGQFPWSGGSNTHWPQQQVNNYGDVSSGSYMKDSDQGLRNMGQNSGWGQQQQQSLMHSGPGYMGYPPQSHWGHHPYPQTPYMHQPSMFGHGQGGSYPTWNYGQGFGSGAPPGGGPYSHEGS